jgi:hypothetical protein
MENGVFGLAEATAVGDETGVGLASALLGAGGWLLQPVKRKVSSNKKAKQRLIISEGCREIALSVQQVTRQIWPSPTTFRRLPPSTAIRDANGLTQE